MRGRPKGGHDVFELCARASALLCEIGFEMVYVSRKTEAVYFRFPGRHGLLRVAAHRHTRSPIGLDEVVGKLTFHGNQFSGHTVLVCSPEKVETMIHIAIGQYMMHSGKPIASQYRGKKGTLEDNPSDKVEEVRG